MTVWRFRRQTPRSKIGTVISDATTLMGASLLASLIALLIGSVLGIVEPAVWSLTLEAFLQRLLGFASLIALIGMILDIFTDMFSTNDRDRLQLGFGALLGIVLMVLAKIVTAVKTLILAFFGASVVYGVLLLAYVFVKYIVEK